MVDAPCDLANEFAALFSISNGCYFYAKAKAFVSLYHSPITLAILVLDVNSQTI